GSGAAADGNNHRTACAWTFRRAATHCRVSRRPRQTPSDVLCWGRDRSRPISAGRKEIDSIRLTHATTIPLLLGTGVGILFEYSATSAIAIGSLLASHTLLALPIITRLGANRLQPVTVAIGATVMSDTLSLVVFAICVSTHVSGFSAVRLVRQIVEI